MNGFPMVFGSSVPTGSSDPSQEGHSVRNTCCIHHGCENLALIGDFDSPN